MKKLTLKILLLSAILSNANAADGYVGLAFQHNSLDVSTNQISLTNGSFKPKDEDFYELKSYNFPSLFIGYNVAENAAIEVNYSYINTSKTNSNTGIVLLPSLAKLNTKSDIKIHNLGLDLKPKVSAGDATFFAIVGLNLLKADITEKFYATGFNQEIDDSKISAGFSVGAGAEYEFIKNLSVLIQGKYTFTPGLEFSKLQGLNSVDNIISLSAGLKYGF